MATVELGLPHTMLHVMALRVASKTVAYLLLPLPSVMTLQQVQLECDAYIIVSLITKNAYTQINTVTE